MWKEAAIYWRRRGSPMLAALLIAVMLASPFADAHPRIGSLMAMVVVCGVVMGASLGGNRRIVVMVTIPLSVLWAVARSLEEFGGGFHRYALMAHVVGLALCCTILWAVFDRMSATPHVTGSVIAEAAINYLIIAIAFAHLYWLLNEFLAEPFNQPMPASQSAAFLYFSMITLTSVGYGGILPINPFLRLVAAFESMAGLFYIAVVVARVVSSYRPEPVILPAELAEAGPRTRPNPSRPSSPPPAFVKSRDRGTNR